MNIKELVIAAQNLIDQGYSQIDVVSYDEDGIAVVAEELTLNKEGRYTRWNPKRKTYECYKGKPSVFIN